MSIVTINLNSDKATWYNDRGTQFVVYRDKQVYVELDVVSGPAANKVTLEVAKVHSLDWRGYKLADWNASDISIEGYKRMPLPSVFKQE